MKWNLHFLEKRISFEILILKKNLQISFKVFFMFHRNIVWQSETNEKNQNIFPPSQEILPVKPLCLSLVNLNKRKKWIKLERVNKFHHHPFLQMLPQNKKGSSLLYAARIYANETHFSTKVVDKWKISEEGGLWLLKICM